VHSTDSEISCEVTARLVYSRGRLPETDETIARIKVTLMDIMQIAECNSPGRTILHPSRTVFGPEREEVLGGGYCIMRSFITCTFYQILLW
jgi:hypothetical protein